MTDEKKNNIWIILFSIIIVLLLIIIFLILTNKNNLNNNKVVEEKNNIINNSNQNIVDEETNWGTYLLSLHLLEAKLTRIRSKDLGDTEDFNQTLTLTKEELANILNNLQQNKLTKVYSQGMGGPTRDELIVSYEKNYNKHTLTITNGNIFVEKLDNEFKQMLDKVFCEIKQEELKDQEGSFNYYDINNYSENVFDKYF